MKYSIALAENMLICPSCHHHMITNTYQLSCRNCQQAYPITNDIIHFFFDKKASTTKDSKVYAEKPKEDYWMKYQSNTGATAYNQKYQNIQKQRTMREKRIIRGLLESVGSVESILDLPSGGGRLSQILAKYARVLIEADISAGQLSYAQQNYQMDNPRLWLQAEALKNPLADKSVDGVLCLRLSHHFHSPEEREKLLCELLRVARHFVIFSFVDSHSVKNLWRSFWQRSKCNTMSTREISQIAKKNAFKLTACPSIGHFRSHRYALIEKK